MSMITIRVPEEVKQKLEKFDVNISETVRNLLDKYLSELESKDLAKRLEDLKANVGTVIDPELIAGLVREDRETR
jgi:antitoxin CcdA